MPLHRSRLNWIIPTLWASIVLVVAVLWAITGVWHSFDYRMQDYVLRQMPEEQGTDSALSRIVYVTITDATYESFGQPYLDRQHVARAIHALTDLGARAIAFDLIFSRHSDSQTDDLLVEAVRESGRVILPVGYRLQEQAQGSWPRATRSYAPFSELRGEAARLGHVSAPADADGVYRHFFPIVLDEQGRSVPALAIAAYLYDLDLGSKALVRDGRTLHIRAPDGRAREIPLDATGRINILYAGRWESDFEKISLDRLLELHQDPLLRGNLLNLIEGRVVLVGDVSTGIADIGATPLETDVPLVAIHAAMLNSLYRNEFARTAADWESVLCAFIPMVLYAGLAMLKRHRYLYLFGGGTQIALLLAWFFAFQSGYYLPGATIFFSSGSVFIALVVFANWRTYQARARIQHENELYRRELEIAHEIQASLIPDKFPELERLEIAAVSFPAREVGGDFYDVFQIDDSHTLVMLADVSGKGVPAAIYMSGAISSLRTILGARHLAQRSVVDISMLLNDFLYHNARVQGKSFYLTALFLLFDMKSGHIQYLRCGHEPLLHYVASEGRVHDRNPGGFVLGAMPSSMVRTRMEPMELALGVGDLLYAYSDGVTEAANPAREFFGGERLRHELHRIGPSTARGALDDLLGKLRSHMDDSPPHDDLSLLVMHWR